MHRNSFWHLCVLVSLIVASMACAPSTTATTSPAPSPEATLAPSPTTVLTAPTAAATPPVFPFSIVDSNGRTVTLAKQPRKFVSLSPSVTEILFALGLGRQVEAVDVFSDYPPEAKAVLNIGGSRGSFNFEKIVELQPDIVFGAGPTSPDVIKKLEDLKVTVAIIGSRKSTIETIMDDVVLTGHITGTPDKAAQISGDIQKKLIALKAKVATAATKPRIYWEIDATSPAKPFSVGPGNFVNDIITLAGGENIFAGAASAFPQVSAEAIVAANPDVIILVSNVAPALVRARSGWDIINAVKNNKVFEVDMNLTSRTGPRVVDGLEATMKLIHPELFN